MSKTGAAAIAASQHIREREYWLEKLSGDLDKTRMPYDHPKSACAVYEFDKVGFCFEDELYSKLIKLSKGADSRLFMVLTTGLMMLLARYTGNEDIIVGTPIFKQEEDANFINTILPIRSKVEAEYSFKDLLLQVRNTIFEACENQNFPIETLLYQLGIESDEDAFPLFDVAVLLENVQDREYLKEVMTNMIISFNNTGEQVEGVIEYNASLYEKGSVERMANHLKNLLLHALSNVHLKPGEIEILSEDERKMLIEAFNNTSKPYPKGKTIHALFEEQAERTPEGIALQYEEKQLTYSRLNQMSTTLAGVLRQKGIGKTHSNNIVGIMVERSLEMVIGMLAVLKAGGAYMPVDPEYPVDRKQFMLDDSGTSVLLVKGGIGEGIMFDGDVIDLKSMPYPVNDQANLEGKQDASSLAYIIYTSGSTGQPKGVLIEHASIVNTLLWRKSYYGFDEKDVVLQIPSFSFDSSVEDIFTPLISGSKLVIVRHQDRFNIVCLEDIINKQKVTHFLITPGLYKTILYESPDCLKSMRVVTLAGERFTEEFVSDHFRLLGNVRLVNEYGPTENSVCTTVYELSPYSTRVLIGKPIHNVKCYIVDQYGCLCPVGIPGQLCTSGNGLARGYLNRPELTEERFINAPFLEGERIYKTGDLARWMPDGNIDFLGRMDHQVKIRGFRVELGEIERCLLKHRKIRDTIVVAKDSEDGGKYLVQYFVSDGELTVQELQCHLAKTLPEYMVPSCFMRLTKIPLTPNGKVNRRALPQPAKCHGLGAEYEPPSNETEVYIAEMWKEILHLEKIGVHDNFFEVGGHSLRATVLVSRIRKKFQVHVPVRAVFKNPTIRQLSQYVMQGVKNAYDSIQPVEERDYYPASPGQKRIYWVSKAEGTSVTYNVPLSLHIDGLLDREKTQRALGVIIERHDAFRTSFDFVDAELVQRVHKDVQFKLEYMEACESELGEIGESFVRVFNFKTAPLLRALLVHLTEGKSVLMLDMHHIISDGVSMDILVKEFVTLYEGKTLPEIKIQYKDFTAWQEKSLSSEEIKKQKEYWMDVLSGELPVLNMPTDTPRPSIQSFEGRKVRASVPEEITMALRRLANETATTFFSVLLGAYNVLLSKYTGQNDIIVGSPVAGRTCPDLENVVGMFINMLALRNSPKHDMTFRDFMEDVGQRAFHAFDNQDYQFNDLVDSLKIDRDMSRSPLFDTMFALQNMDFRQSEIDGLRFTMKDIDTKISKFDITVVAIERNNETELIFEYCTKLYKDETIVRFAQHFITILKKISQNPDLKLKEISIVDDKERDLLLTGFNRTKTEYPKDKTVLEMFEAKVKEFPDNIAVVHRGNAVTYSELNRKANRLARKLREGYNATREDIVAIMVQGSVEMMAGIIGILKSGAAYLPIDPSYPPDRVKTMMQDSKAIALLTDNPNSMVDIDNPIPVIDIRDERAYCADDSNLEIVNTPKDLAYVIYTSGSTGKPKGVMIEHRSLMNLCWWHITHYGVTAEDRSTKYAGIGFDASVWEIFPYIIAGASIHIIDDEMKLNMMQLNEYFEANQITISFLPTQISEQFIDLTNTSLRKLLTGGDKLNRFEKRDYELINNYGPTENTVVTTSFTVDGNYDNIPIGRPISNTRVYIVDPYNHLQPIGVPGELCIAGDSLARGYLNNPDLTQKKFVPNPFEPGNSMYRTGDLARWLADGNIEFMGRIDSQIKIRGNRIEPGEIESRLLLHEDIQETVVAAVTDKSENKHLCAYIVSDKELASAQLREYLSRSLPGYMIPSFFVRLESLPLTPSGKVDVKALPHPGGTINTGVAYVAPGDETQQKLVEIWQEATGLNKIGINDNFFDIGGNSLLIMKVISRISTVFNLSEDDITVMTMFQYPTIALMAKQLDGHEEESNQAFDSISSRVHKRRQATKMLENRRSIHA